jgi:hypothetical protein
MPRTRSGVASNKSVSEGKPDPPISKVKKRRSADGHESPKPAAKRAKKANTEPKSTGTDDETKPCLTTPDLEFDYDRNDPRPTPGRIKRPRFENSELSEDWKRKFYIPEPDKPPGRLNAVQKDILYEKKALLDPSDMFHHLYVCHKKGPNGSPTYDSAGFELDWHKVDRWMKPQPYNKNAMVKGMERAVDKAVKDNRKMYEIFFEDGKPPSVHDHIYGNYMKDHVSKDLGIPFHQITPAYFQEWEQKGFTKAKAKLWWHEPNDVEKQRMLKMQIGCSLRKDL